MANKTQLTKDTANKKVVVIRDFDAPVDKVWRAWTESELLDQWWAPEPWKAKTKNINFTEGGSWLYAMVGPDGTEIWARLDYKKIAPQNYYTSIDSFCDSEGKKNADFPSMNWKNTFHKNGEATKVEVEITFASEGDIDKIMEMGFEQGFAMAHDNLDRLLLKMNS